MSTPNPESEPRERIRWRDRPRQTLLRWDLGREYVLFAIVVGLAWWMALTYGVAAIAGHTDPAGDKERWKSALTALIALGVAVPLSRLAWLYLDRPVVHPWPKPIPRVYPPLPPGASRKQRIIYWLKTN